MSGVHLHLHQLAVGYNGRALIHGIEIGVRRGEIVTLIGPNGAGKSTILKSITRQLEPIDGKVLLEMTRTAGSSKAESLKTESLKSIKKTASLLETSVVSEGKNLPQFLGLLLQLRLCAQSGHTTLMLSQLQLQLFLLNGAIGDHPRGLLGSIGQSIGELGRGHFFNGR